MIRILNIPAKETAIHSHCGAVLEFDKRDIEVIICKSYIVLKYLICPHCKEQMII